MSTFVVYQKEAKGEYITREIPNAFPSQNVDRLLAEENGTVIGSIAYRIARGEGAEEAVQVALNAGYEYVPPDQARREYAQRRAKQPTGGVTLNKDELRAKEAPPQPDMDPRMQYIVGLSNKDRTPEQQALYLAVAKEHGFKPLKDGTKVVSSSPNEDAVAPAMDSGVQIIGKTRGRPRKIKVEEPESQTATSPQMAPEVPAISEPAPKPAESMRRDRLTRWFLKDDVAGPRR